MAEAFHLEKPNRGIAALVSVSAVTQKPYIHLFHNTPEGHLAVEVRPVTKGTGPEKTLSAVDNYKKGIVALSSHLGSAVSFLGMNLVVGITETYYITDGTPTFHVSVISPVYKPLAWTDYSKGIAVCSSTDDAFIFYLGINENDGSRVTIKGATLDQSATVKVKDDVDVHPQSSLAAYWGPPEEPAAYVIYQSTKSGGTLYDADHLGDYNEPIVSSNGARPGTPIAVTWTPDNKAVVYYIGDDSRLRRIVKDPTKSQKQPWGAVKVLAKIDSYDERSQLSVVTVDNKNHVYYVSGDRRLAIKEVIDDYSRV